MSFPLTHDGHTYQVHTEVHEGDVATVEFDDLNPEWPESLEPSDDY